VVSFLRHEGVWWNGCQTPLILTLSIAHGSEWSVSHVMKAYGGVNV